MQTLLAELKDKQSAEPEEPEKAASEPAIEVPEQTYEEITKQSSASAIELSSAPISPHEHQVTRVLNKHILYIGKCVVEKCT